MAMMAARFGAATVAAAILMGMAGAAEAKQCTTYVQERLNVVGTRWKGAAGQQFYGYMPGAAPSEWVSKSGDKQFVNTFSGNATTWYDKAANYPGGGAVSATPKAGYVMVFAATGEKASGAGTAFPTGVKYASSVGHVAYVTQDPTAKTVNGASVQEIKVDHANWSLAGKVDGNTVTNASMISKDAWTTAQVEYYSDGKRTDKKGNTKPVAYGSSSYAVKGFVNPAAMTKLTIPKKK